MINVRENQTNNMVNKNIKNTCFIDSIDKVHKHRYCLKKLEKLNILFW